MISIIYNYLSYVSKYVDVEGNVLACSIDEPIILTQK